MRDKNVAIIGDSDSVLGFRALGVAAFPVTAREEAYDTLKTLARSYKVIFVTEQWAETLSELLERYKTRAYPIVIPVPSATGSNGIGMEGIKKDVEKAIGSDIIFK